MERFPRFTMALGTALAGLMGGTLAFGQVGAVPMPPVVDEVAAEELAADARMARMLFIADAPATADERFRALKVVRDAIGNELLCMLADVPEGTPPTERMQRYQKALDDVEGRMEALSRILLPQMARAAVADMENKRLALLRSLNAVERDLLPLADEVDRRKLEELIAREELTGLTGIPTEGMPEARRIEVERLKLDAVARVAQAVASKEAAEARLQDAKAQVKELQDRIHAEPAIAPTF